jgi:hypothetical protein
MVGARRRKNGWTSRSLYTCVQVIGFLHCGGPFGVVVPAPPFLLCGGLHFGGFFDTGLGGWSCGFALFFYRRWVLSFGRVDVPVQPASAVTRVEVPIQPGEFILFSLSFFLPMLYQWNTHYLVRAVRLKKINYYAVARKFRRKPPITRNFEIQVVAVTVPGRIIFTFLYVYIKSSPVQCSRAGSECK